jgi:hypothetical protein
VHVGLELFELLLLCDAEMLLLVDDEQPEMGEPDIQPLRRSRLSCRPGFFGPQSFDDLWNKNPANES